jgi:deoxyhypusine synthase
MVWKPVIQISLERGISISQLVESMERSGVLGAGSFGRAFKVSLKMLSDPDFTVLLTLAGPMIPGGLRKIIHMLITRRLIEGVVTSGANVVHDITEALGYPSVQGSYTADDVDLGAENIGRAGDIYFPHEGFEALEKKTYQILDTIRGEQKGKLSVSELLTVFGSSLNDRYSVIVGAREVGIPIFCPAVLDSMLGLHIWTYSQLHPLNIDLVKDMSHLSDIIYKAKKMGAIILGGGTSKHFLLGACTLIEGLDAAIQITLDRPEGGSLSGAPLREAVSWGKAKAGSQLVTVIGDATILFPILISACLEKMDCSEQ